jgi:hypothetical protein
MAVYTHGEAEHAIADATLVAGFCRRDLRVRQISMSWFFGCEPRLNSMVRPRRH